MNFEKEGDINPWYQSGPFENEVREITDDRDKMYSRITNNVKKHYEGQFLIILKSLNFSIFNFFFLLEFAPEGFIEIKNRFDENYEGIQKIIFY